MGLYYLQSRYYDPQTCRFVNGDGVVPATGSSVQGYSMFVYCMNNPVNMIDSTGNWPQFIETAANWLNNNVIKPVKQFFTDIAQDIKNFDINNQSEQKALKSNYVAGYKGKLVIRIDGNRSGSFGAIFLTRETNNRDNPEDVVRHEYGHTKQLQELGPIKYALAIGLPSALEMGGGDYYSRPWEITADIYGGVQSRYHTMKDIEAGFLYLEYYKNDVRPPFVLIFVE